MKTPAGRSVLMATLAMGVVVVAVWLAIGRKQAPLLVQSVKSVAASNAPAASRLVFETPPPAHQPSQAGELVDAIQRVLASDKLGLTSGEAGAILSLPNDDILKKVVISENIIRGLAKSYPQKYAALFQQLGLNAAEAQLMINLLIGRQLLLRENLDYLRSTEVGAQVDFEISALGGPKGMAANGNTADLSDVPQRRAAALAPIETEISNWLGSDKYALYESYMTGEPVRSNVDSFQTRLQWAGATGLSYEQQAQLQAVMLAEQTPLSGLYRLNQITDNTVQAAKTFLAPAQQQVLERVLWENNKVNEAIVAAEEAKRREKAAVGK